METLELVIWPDADWYGDSTSTRSTSGLYVKLVGGITGHEFPLTWKVTHQTATSSSSAESETVSASVALRMSALPIRSLLLEMLGLVVPIRVCLDNAQAQIAIKKGYSKRRLQYMLTTKRLAFTKEISFCNTKELGPSMFQEALGCGDL